MFKWIFLPFERQETSQSISREKSRVTVKWRENDKLTTTLVFKQLDINNKSQLQEISQRRQD